MGLTYTTFVVHFWFQFLGISMQSCLIQSMGCLCPFPRFRRVFFTLQLWM